MQKILNYLKYALLSKSSRCIYLCKRNFFFSEFHDIQLYFYYLANYRKTGRERKRSDWLAACDRQTVPLITFPVCLPLLTTLEMDSDIKLFGGNPSFPTIKQKQKRRKQNIFFGFLSAGGELMFLWFESHLMVKWLGQRALAAFPWGLGCGGGGREGCHMTRCDPAEDGGAWQLLSHADVVQME